MAKNIVWRKLPIGIIRDEEMDLIADQLPQELKAAPYMFYLTALCKADDDGTFDLGDGVIFSRLMRIGSPADVFKIANLMMKRKLILRAGNSTRCIICNWEYPEKETPRTMAQRRAIVAQKIEEERKITEQTEFSFKSAQPSINPSLSFFNQESELFPSENKHPEDSQIAAAVAAATMVNNVFGTPGADFLCADDDKNKKMSSKNRNRERDRKIRYRKNRHTHRNRRQERYREACAPGFRRSSLTRKHRRTYCRKIRDHRSDTGRRSDRIRNAKQLAA